MAWRLVVLFFFGWDCWDLALHFGAFCDSDVADSCWTIHGLVWCYG